MCSKDLHLVRKVRVESVVSRLHLEVVCRSCLQGACDVSLFGKTGDKHLVRSRLGRIPNSIVKNNIASILSAVFPGKRDLRLVSQSCVVCKVDRFVRQSDEMGSIAKF